MSAPRVKLDIDASREKLASLGCSYAAEALEALLAEAVRNEMPAHVFLDRLLVTELAGREERRIKVMLKGSKIRKRRLRPIEYRGSARPAEKRVSS